MTNIDNLPVDILQKIQEYLNFKECIRLPSFFGQNIKIIKFPFRSPIQHYDMDNFHKWIIKRKESLSKSVTTLLISNINDYMKNDTFLSILEILFSFPHVQSITLHHFRSDFLIYYGLRSVHLFMLLYQRFFTMSNSLKYVNIDVPFLLHFHPSIQLDCLNLGFHRNIYTVNNRTYVYETGTYPLRVLLKRLKESNGFIKKLIINKLEINKIYPLFWFLFNPDLDHNIGSIHFQGCRYSNDPVLMLWTQNNIRYSVATEYDIKNYPLVKKKLYS